MHGFDSKTADCLRAIPDIDVDLAACGAIAGNGLPPPVVITLERRPDRWETAKDRLYRRGFHRLIRAVAIDAQQVSRSLLEPLMVNAEAVDDAPQHYLHMTRPAVGCFLSHLAIWKRFLSSDEPYILVLEDDAVPAPDLDAARGRAIMDTMPNDADMLLLGCTIMDGLAEPSGSPQFSRVYYFNGTFAYILTREGCSRLLRAMLPIKTHIDNQISIDLVNRRKNFHVYCTEPRCFEHDFAVVSDVYVPVADTDRADKMLDAVFKDARAHLVRQGARLFDPFKPHA